MIEEIIELNQHKISVLEQKLEKYYQLLNVENELSFILKGSYILNTDIENLLNGQ